MGLAQANELPPHVVNGTPVTQGNYPWFVFLSMGCGGSVINANWILTAAHCFNAAGTVASNIKVISGRGYFQSGAGVSGWFSQAQAAGY